MSFTSESICNMALGHLKISKEIAVLESEKSPEAAACRLFYPTCRSIVMADFKWPFATTQLALALIEENPFSIEDDDDDAEDDDTSIEDWSEWAFSYDYPANAGNIVRIISGIRNESRQDRIPYRVMRGSDGRKIIVTDMEDAVAEFTVDEDVEDRFTPGFAMALSLKLAVYIAPRVTGGDPFKLGERCMRLYQMELEAERGRSLNEEQVEEDPEAESIRARY